MRFIINTFSVLCQILEELVYTPSAYEFYMVVIIFMIFNGL